MSALKEPARSVLTLAVRSRTITRAAYRPKPALRGTTVYQLWIAGSQADRRPVCWRASRPTLRRYGGRQPAGLRRPEPRHEVVARLLDELPRLGEVGLQSEIVLEDLPVDHHGPYVRDVGGADHRPDGVDDRRDVDGLRIDDDEVGLLARRQRARTIGDAGDLGPIDRRPAKDLPRVDEVRGRRVAVEILIPGCLMAAGPLRREDRVHLRELVG